MSVSTVFAIIILSVETLCIAIFFRSLVRIVRKKGLTGVTDYLLLVFSFCLVYVPFKMLWEYEKSERIAAQRWALECVAEYGRESDECRHAFERLEFRGWELEETEPSDVKPRR